MNGSGSIFLRSYIEPSSFQKANDVGGSYLTHLRFHNFHARFCDPEIIETWSFRAKSSQCGDRAAQPIDLILKDGGLMCDLTKSLCGSVEVCPRFLQGCFIRRCLLIRHEESI